MYNNYKTMFIEELVTYINAETEFIEWFSHPMERIDSNFIYNFYQNKINSAFEELRLRGVFLDEKLMIKLGIMHG